MQYIEQTFAPHGGPSRLEADGRKGRKNGRGYYRYRDGKRIGVDESVDKVLGISKYKTTTPDEIQKRLVFQLLNEAARCFEDGVLRSSRDGDIGAVFRIGFPLFRGGPFVLIDTVGPKAIVDQLKTQAAQHGSRFEPAQIRRNATKSGQLLRRKT